MNIDNNCVVTLHYNLSDEHDKLIYTSENDEALSYLHGWGELVDGLEKALTGKKANDKFQVTISPEDGYGDEDPNLIQVMPMKTFNGIEINEGMELQGEDPEGGFRLLRIIKIDGDDVTINMNHPLAGKILKFSVHIESVRAATETEIAHGHAHIDGDFQH
ncbi:MAG: peptidylprolyl isomerase [Gammaproteobacteria bacterium]|nr:peptidylprolyl isomerase [Gammaproteobacteria bacterium]MCP4089040.1 peptidylprolyl isomerase [Gammaproteobacteria bacterium]MCP4278060.1 peptidylprolyl isomerase [Gammaproteobacteria bacterium]MCP4833036.1 peptidylprolyl isomerase [Gammaproteobacteria bacterium]MCP4929009.1 peptidylprolyl isomerase [Gammaproteobacteria bacterium]